MGVSRQRLLAVPPKPPCSHQPLPGRTRGLQGPGCGLGAGLRPWQALPCPRLAPHPRADRDSAKRASVSPAKATLTGRGAHRPPRLQGSGACLPTGEHAAGCPQVRLSHVSTLHLSGVRAPGVFGGNDCSSGQLPLRAGAGSRPSPLVICGLSVPPSPWTSARATLVHLPVALPAGGSVARVLPRSQPCTARRRGRSTYPSPKAPWVPGLPVRRAADPGRTTPPPPKPP